MNVGGDNKIDFPKKNGVNEIYLKSYLFIKLILIGFMFRRVQKTNYSRYD